MGREEARFDKIRDCRLNYRLYNKAIFDREQMHHNLKGYVLGLNGKVTINWW